MLYVCICYRIHMFTQYIWASHLRRLLLTMSILCLTHVDACLVPSHSRAKVQQVLDKIYHQVGFLKREKKHMHIVIVYNRKKKKTEKLIQCDTSRPFSYGILIWFKTISFNTRINFWVQNFLPGFVWSRHWTSTWSWPQDHHQHHHYPPPHHPHHPHHHHLTWVWMISSLNLHMKLASG